MNKIGLLFPGQGSQYIGMGKDTYEKYPEAKALFDKSNEVLGFDLKKVIFEGPEETLKQTQYTQPAIFTTSIALYKVFSIHYSLSTIHCFSAGHSLGEYSALCAAGFFTFEDGLKLVKARGEFIAQASSNNSGTMAAIIGLDKEKLSAICSQTGGVCQMVNFNSPGQIVIAGTIDAVNNAVKLATEAGATKAIVLNVSGPFHSSLMNEASEMMNKELEKYTFKKPGFSVYTNIDAAITNTENDVKTKLVKQICNPVLWEDTISNMIKNGVDIFVEIGPGRVLSGLLRRIDKTKKSFNIEDSASMEKTINSLKEVLK